MFGLWVSPRDEIHKKNFARKIQIPMFKKNETRELHVEELSLFDAFDWYDIVPFLSPYFF